MSKKMYATIACGVTLQRKALGNGSKEDPEAVGGAVLLRKHGSYMLPILQYSDKNIIRLKEKIHKHVDKIFESVPEEIYETHKIEITKKRDLPLLIGSLKSTEAQKLLEERLRK